MLGPAPLLDLEAEMAKTVLIVEDNELNMKLFNDLLESRGCKIIQTPRLY